MAFLDKFSSPDYTDANIYQFERRRREPRQITESVSWEPNPYMQSRGVIDRVGNRPNPSSGGNPTAGLLGIQNTTGFAQEAPNVVYDQQPEQFEKELKLKKRALDIQEGQVAALAGLKNFDAETRRIAAEGRNSAADTRNDIAMFRAQNPNLIIKASAGGNYYAVDPQTGQVVDTGIPVGNMTQEDALTLRNKGAESVANIGATSRESVANIGATSRENVARIGATSRENVANTGAASRERVASMNNNNDIAVQYLRNSGILAAISARGEEAQALEQLRQSGALERLGVQLRQQRDNSIYRENSNTWRTRYREGDINPEDPVEGRPPQFPARDIPLPGAAPAPINIGPSGLNLGSGGVLSGGAINELGSIQISPEQMRGFGATPGQYTAAPNQYSAPAPGQAPVNNAQPQQNEALMKQAEAILTQQGKPVTPANIAYVMQQLQTKGSTTTPGQLGAGVVAGQSAGTLSGPSAGTVRR